MNWNNMVAFSRSYIHIRFSHDVVILVNLINRARNLRLIENIIYFFILLSIEISILLSFPDFFQIFYFSISFSILFCISICIIFWYFYYANIFVETREWIFFLRIRLFCNTKVICKMTHFIKNRYTIDSFCFFRFLSIHINLRVPRLIDSSFNFIAEQVIRLRAMTLTRRRIVSCSVDAFRYV